MKGKIYLFLVVIGLLNPLYSEEPQKTALVCGAGGFIGYHLVKRYKDEGYWVRGVDIKYPEFGATHADEFIIADLRFPEGASQALSGVVFDEVCQLAANMGGMGFISSHDAEIMHDSALINLNVLEECRKTGAKKIFYTSSACIYPERNQLDPNNPKCSEDSAYPAAPDTEYGWEKLFSERLYQAYARDYGMDTRIVRLHNVFGPQGTWRGGREKAPAALSRKVAEAANGSSIQIWGKGDQTRSFLYIDECIEGIRRVMLADATLPIMNLGSEEMISINDLALLIARIAGKDLTLKNVPGPEGVRGRNSDNALMQETLHWQPSQSLETGLRKLYPWIEAQVSQQAEMATSNR
jgi:GDP-D-mannose 3',5'-epimerase